MKICCMTLQLAPFQPLWFWWLYVEILEPPDRTNLDPWLIWRELLWRATGLAADFLQVRIYCVCVRESIIVLEFIYPCSKTYPTLANTCGKIDPHTFQISESTWRQRTFPSTKTFSQVATGEIFNNCTTTLCQTLLVILTPLGVLFASQVISNPILKSILAPAFSV